jgi:probable rRNA maturation factor
MILLDPDLDPDAAPGPAAGKPVAAPKASDLRLPSTQTLARFLSQARLAARLRGKVSVLLTTDAAQRGFNRRFRGKNKSTDVLSFPAAPSAPGAPVADQFAGDLSISVPIACRQAAQQGHSLTTEIKVLILHGVLHLAGYDHEIDSGQMARRERTLRAHLGLPGGLIERTSAAKSKLRATSKSIRPATKRRRA